MITGSPLPLFFVAALFLLSASYKMGNHRPLQVTLERLGARNGVAVMLSRAAPFAETALAVAAVGPWWQLAVVSVTLGGCIITAAGVMGLRLADPVPCACFSAQSSRPLGWRQVMVGSALGAIAAHAAIRHPGFSTEGSAVSLTAACTLAVIIRVYLALPMLSDLVHARKALASRYPA